MSRQNCERAAYRQKLSPTVVVLLTTGTSNRVCGNDPDYFKAISPWVTAEGAAAALRDKKTAIRHVVGAWDDTRNLNRQFHERMTDLQIPHEYSELPNVGHDARALLTALGERSGDSAALDCRR